MIWKVIYGGCFDFIGANSREDAERKAKILTNGLCSTYSLRFIA